MERGTKRKADWLQGADIVQNFKKQLTHQLNEGKPYGPPSDKTTLMTGSNSLIGQQSGVSRMAGLAPFKGLDPETKKINAFAKFQIEPAVNRPQSAKNVLFSNDHEDTYEEPANPSVVWPYNCLLISGKLPLTWQCIGRRQLMFSYHPSTLTNLSRECENDVKLVSVSMLNAISWSGGEQIHRCSEYKSSDPERFVDEWRLSGVVQEVEPIAEGRLLKHPLATIVVQGVAKAINLWAACVPKPHQLSRLWLLLVRRPRNFEKARKVRDAWCKLKQLALLPPRVRSQEQQADFVELRRCLYRFDVEEKEEDTFMCWEPHVESANVQPPSYLYSGHGWKGHARYVGQVIDRYASELCGDYASLLDDILYPQPEKLEKYVDAISTDGTAGNKYGIPSIEIDVGLR
jgi:hypothetical protein